MALEIFKLVGSIFVDNDAANKSIKKTDEKAQGFGKTLLKGIGTAGKWAAGLVAGAAAVATGITAAANSTAAACDEIDKMSQKIGISREAYQELDFILSQNGMDVNKLQSGMKTLVNSMQSASEGSAKAVSAFDALGVSATNADGSLRSQEDVFYDSIAALQAMSNETERNAIANQLFGKSATELAPLLNSGAGSMEELRQKAHDLGLVLNDDVVNSGVNLTDTMDQLKRSFSAIGANLGGVLMPVVQNVAQFIIDNMPTIQSAVQQLAPVLTTLFQELVPPLLDLASSLLPAIIQLFNAIMPLISKIITAIVPVIINLLQKLLPLIVQIIEQVLPIFIQLIDALLPIITEIINTVLPIILDLIQAILPPLLDLIQAILPVVLDLIQKILPFILQVTEQVLPMIVDLLDAVLPLLVQIVEAILPVFVELVETILPPIMEIVNTILPLLIDLFNAILPVVIQLIEAVLPIVISLLDTIAPILSPILELLSALLSPLLELLNMILPPIITLFTEIIEKVMPPLQKAFSGVANVITTVFNKAFSFVGSLIGNIKDVLSGVISFIKNVFTGNWKGAWEAIKKIFSGIWEGIKTAFKTPINWIISGINVFIRGINKIKIPDWVPLVGGKGFHISEIPALAQGGVLEKGQVGFLEGNGAEAVVPLHNNRKWIHAVAEDMDSAMGGSTSVVQTILLDILSLLEKITGMRIVLDTGVLAGELAEPIDERLGRIKAQKARA